MAEVHAAIQTCLAWDTIYDPTHERVISPVSRNWSVGSGGYVLFCWDNYFAAYLASVDNRDLAYANAVEITRERTPAGFVPNVASRVCGFTSLDRSQPPWDRWWCARVVPPLSRALAARDALRRSVGLEPLVGPEPEYDGPADLGLQSVRAAGRQPLGS